MQISDDEFEEKVLKAATPVLVDCWAEWCGPCKMIAPILEDVAREYADRLVVGKVNIDHNPQTPTAVWGAGIPTLILFKEGEVEGTKVGAVAKSQLVAFIDSNL
jgi:thioredoxin 1